MRRIARRRMSIFRRPLGHPHLCCPKERGQSHRSIRYICCGETSKNVGCSIRSAWVGVGAAFDKSGHDEVWEVQEGTDGHKISFLWRLGFPVMSRRVSSLIWVVLDERLAVVGRNFLQRGKGTVYRRRVLNGSTCISSEGVLEVKAGQKWRRDSQKLLYSHFCDSLPNPFSVYHKGKGTQRYHKGIIQGRRMKRWVG